MIIEQLFVQPIIVKQFQGNKGMELHRSMVDESRDENKAKRGVNLVFSRCSSVRGS